MMNNTALALPKGANMLTHDEMMAIEGGVWIEAAEIALGVSVFSYNEGLVTAQANIRKKGKNAATIWGLKAQSVLYPISALLPGGPLAVSAFMIGYNVGLLRN